MLQSGFKIHLAQEAKKPRIQHDLVDTDNRPDAKFVIVESTFLIRLAEDSHVETHGR